MTLELAVGRIVEDIPAGTLAAPSDSGRVRIESGEMVAVKSDFPYGFGPGWRVCLARLDGEWWLTQAGEGVS